MDRILAKVSEEPVLVTALVSAALALAVSFGVSLDDTQLAAINAVVVAVLAIVARGKVTPTNKL